MFEYTAVVFKLDEAMFVDDRLCPSIQAQDGNGFIDWSIFDSATVDADLRPFS